MRSGWVLTLLAMSAILAGCGTATHDVRIDAQTAPIPAGAAPPKSYWIRTRGAPDGEESLRYKEAVGYIKTALSGKGMYEAPNEESAEMIIDMDYSVQPKRKAMDVIVDAGTPAVEKPKPAPKSKAARKEGDAEPAKPAYYLREMQVDTTIYEKRLSLEAHHKPRDADDHTPELLWKVTATSTGEENDLRKYVPILAASTIEYIGRETEGEREVKVDDQGVDIAFVKKGM